MRYRPRLWARGILPVDLYGHPVNLDLSYKLRKKMAFCIKDAAEAFGARWGQRLGAWYVRRLLLWEQDHYHRQEAW
jgi:dTDP-4-amino-4,6-dideoxygalactose transaminase